MTNTRNNVSLTIYLRRDLAEQLRANAREWKADLEAVVGKQLPMYDPPVSAYLAELIENDTEARKG